MCDVCRVNRGMGDEMIKWIHFDRTWQTIAGKGESIHENRTLIFYWKSKRKDCLVAADNTYINIVRQSGTL